ncbi:MAG: penicillin-binding protein 2 [Lachnospiraceae bacterium]|nr:penicillin-binding protein 2 [Lachnospiraceae bacterium]
MARGQNTRVNNQSSGNRKQQNTTRFRPYMRVKLVVFCIIVVLAIFVLVGRLIHITSTSEAKYKKQVLSQQKYDSATLPYKRGDILDRNGSTLAYSEKVYNVILDTKVMMDDEANYNPTLKALDSCFDVDIDKIKAYVSENPSSQYYKVAKQVTYQEKTAYEAYVEQQEELAKAEAEAKDVKNTGAHIKGIWFEEEYIRKYPYSTLASDVLGFTGKDNAGQFGLEEYYNDVLNGTTGREYGYLNDDSELQRTIKPADNGHSIVSTLDLNIQRIVETVIDNYNEELRDNFRAGDGAENMAVIVMDVNNGSVLAMATNKGFDCSNPYDLSAFYSDEEVEAMQERQVDSDTGKEPTEETRNTISEYSYVLNQRWRNFCLSDTYEPGSVAKPFTVAMCLEEGVVHEGDTWLCEGTLYRGGWPITCHEKSGHGIVGLSYSIQESCNVAMMYMSEKLGAEKFAQYQNAFGFGLKSNIDLTGEARTASLIHTIDTMGVSELATSSFGQGFQVSMIQMAASFSSLVNGGYLYQPQMVRQILDENGNVVKNIEPLLIKQTVSASTSEKIVQYCNATVVDGTGEKAKPAGYAIGGKTGTSETIPRGNREYVVSFMGYAPAEDPQVLVYVVIDRPNVEDQSLSTKYACWMARDIFADMLPYMNIFMTEELTEEEQQAINDKQQAIKDDYQNKRDEAAANSEPSNDTTP